MVETQPEAQNHYESTKFFLYTRPKYIEQKLPN